MWSVRANLTILLTNDTRWESQTFTCMHRVERSFSASPTHLFKTPSQHPRRQAGRSSAEEENNYGDHKLQHLYFDEVTITVSGGQGGDGEAWLASKPKTVRNFKYKWGRNTKKFIELPAAEPADGGRGGNVYIRVDRSCESLLHIHQRKSRRLSSSTSIIGPSRGGSTTLPTRRRWTKMSSLLSSMLKSRQTQ